SVSELHTLTQKFWFYLRLIADTPTPSKQDRSEPSSIVKQILGTKFATDFMPANLTCEVESTHLAVNIDLAEWLFIELLDYLLDQNRTNTYLKINGQSIDNAFHFSLSSFKENNSSISTSEISNLIQFNPTPDEESELPIGLKIVKKIVEIYDGVFLISGIDQDQISIYVNLPLAAEIEALTAAAHLSSQN
ncbi:MAG: response regulator, partial [Chamaesiphon sp.]|nr:response regulator [Chamaesiphon sp.]